MRPWYLPTCVNIAMPVTSPIAQTPSAARQRSSISMPRGPGSTPTVSRPMSRVRGRRPVATTTSAPRASLPSSSVDDLLAALLADGDRAAAEQELDAVLLEDLAEQLADLRVLAVGEARRALHDRHAAAEPGQELRQLDRDDAAADEDGALRDLGQGRRLAVRPVGDVGEAGDGWDDRLGAGRDDDRVRLERSAARLDAARPGDVAGVLDDRDAALLVARRRCFVSSWFETM